MLLSELNERYRVKRKGLKTMIEELKQRMIAKNTKVRRYQQRAEQFSQSRIFDFGQKRVYAKSNGDGEQMMYQMLKKAKKVGYIKSVGKGNKREVE